LKYSLKIIACTSLNKKEEKELDQVKDFMDRLKKEQIVLKLKKVQKLLYLKHQKLVKRVVSISNSIRSASSSAKI
jgi:hypothetical protein